VKEIALFRKKIAENLQNMLKILSCEMQNLNIFWGMALQTPLVILLRVNLGKLFVSPL
jgi:hypothetical protein